MRPPAALAALLLAALPVAATAQQLARYSIEVPAASAAARDPLSEMVSVTGHPGASLLEAARQALAGTGYALATGAAASPAHHRLMSRQLPATQWDMGPLPARRALRALAGPAFLLVEDPVNRLVGFDLRSPYRGAWRFPPAGAASSPPASSPRAAPPNPAPPPDPATGFDLQLGSTTRHPPPGIVSMAPGRATLRLATGGTWEAIPRDIINGWRVLSIDARRHRVRFEASDGTAMTVQALTL